MSRLNDYTTFIKAMVSCCGIETTITFQNTELRQ